jgi:hypothetical protein
MGMLGLGIISLMMAAALPEVRIFSIHLTRVTSNILLFTAALSSGGSYIPTIDPQISVRSV